MAGKERRRTRIAGKIDLLPPETRARVDAMLADNGNTLEEISRWLKGEGYDISRGSVGRYALRANQAAQRVADNLQKTKAIVEMLEQHPEVDAGRASQALMLDGLMQRLSTADAEWQDMPLEDAGRLVASLRRVDLADKRLKLEQRKRIDLAFEGLEEQLMNSIKATPELAQRLRQLLIEAKTAIMDEGK